MLTELKVQKGFGTNKAQIWLQVVDKASAEKAVPYRSDLVWERSTGACRGAGSPIWSGTHFDLLWPSFSWAP